MKIVSVLIPLLFFISSSLSAGQIHDRWGELLERHVRDGVVDYHGFRQSEKQLDEYLQLLADTDPESLDNNDRLAFYINAYNGYTIKLILDNFKDGKPVASIRKIGGFFSNPWKIAFARIGGNMYTLDNIEHDIIRKEFTEPRIHFAVNCASISCPPLISEPYEGKTLDAQLEKSTRDFLADRDHNYLEDDTLYVSSIFKWYGEDFNDDPVAFFLAHTDGELHEEIRSRKEIRVKYLDYDWRLNNRE